MRYIENPYSCPITRTISIIGGKWKPIILNIIGMAPIRFGKLSQMIPAISNKVLSAELKDLEKIGLIIRREDNFKINRVEYRLSEKGETLLPVLEKIGEWGQSHTAISLEESLKN